MAPLLGGALLLCLAVVAPFVGRDLLTSIRERRHSAVLVSVLVIALMGVAVVLLVGW